MSLNAVARQSDAPRFMLWRDLLQAMEQRLGYAQTAGRGVSDALRLASEFESAFGPTALENLLKEAAPDEHYDPGPLHELLFSLPWADVFTTNYDRLLERAVTRIPETRYSVITCVADIPIASHPRIVKLHGSFPSGRPFIITEEHYRTYRRRLAPFVNLVQQAVMETVFCLIGFSGDDPNFLQWSGWVRDELGEAAPPIYLCGVLDLTDQQQHILRTRRIIPVDLAARFPSRQYPSRQLRYAHALEWLLRSLASGSPKDPTRWPEPERTSPSVPTVGTQPILDFAPADTVVHAHARLPHDERVGPGAVIALCSHWAVERKQYPGWVTMPEFNRSQFWSATSHSGVYQRFEEWNAALAVLPSPYALQCWYEFAWRIERCLMPLQRDHAEAVAGLLGKINPYPHLLSDLPEANHVCDDPVAVPDGWPASQHLTWDNIANTWVEMAFMILRNAREEFEAPQFSLWEQRLAAVAALHPRWSARLRIERALRHVFLLQSREALGVLRQGSPSPNHFDEGQRAALLAELGDVDDARRIVEGALVAIQSDITGRTTLRISSEEGWLVWLSLMLDDRNEEDDAPRNRAAERRRRLHRLSHLACDPRDHIQDRDYKLRGSALREFNDSIPDEEFDPGYVSNNERFRFEDPYAWFLVRTLEMGAMFVTAPVVRIFPAALETAAQTLFRDEPKYALSLMLRLCDRRVIIRMFDRATVALLPQDIVNHAFELCAGVLEAASAQPNTNEEAGLGSTVIVPACELVSRLWFRLRNPELSRARRLALAVYHLSYRSEDNSELPRATGLLFRRAFQAMNIAEFVAFVPELLRTPLPIDRDAPWNSLVDPFDEIRLPEPLDTSAIARDDSDTEAVAALLRSARDRGTLRSRAIHRLHRLHLIGFLNEHEARDFGVALWNDVRPNGIPSVDGYLLHAFLSLPTPDGIDRLSIIRQALMGSTPPDILQNDESRATVSGLAAEAENYFIGFENSSAPLLRLETHHCGVQWTGAECDVILDRLTTWVAANVTERNRGHKSTASLFRSFCRFVARSIVPIVSNDRVLLSKVLRILRTVAGGDRSPLGVRAVDLVVGDIDATELQEMLLAPFYESELANDQVLEAGNGLLLWLSYKAAGVVENGPIAFIGEVLTCMLARRGTALRYCIQFVCVVVHGFPEILSEDDHVLFRRVLRALLSASMLPASLPIDPPARAAARGIAQLRAAATKLASELHYLYVSEHRQIPEVLETWRELARRDVLPEVRHAWQRNARSVGSD